MVEAVGVVVEWRVLVEDVVHVQEDLQVLLPGVALELVGDVGVEDVDLADEALPILDLQLRSLERFTEGDFTLLCSAALCWAYGQP